MISKKEQDAMLIAYMSRTGNVRRFAGKLDMRTAEIDEGAVIHEPFIFVTYSPDSGTTIPYFTGKRRNYALIREIRDLYSISMQMVGNP